MHEPVNRPWGAWKLVHQEQGKAVKIITVSPSSMLSLQAHHKRAETWIPLDNGLMAYVVPAGDGNGIDVSPRDEGHLTAMVPLRVAARMKHRLINPTDHSISLIEVIEGIYDEEDIRRYHDAYGRG